MSDQTTVVTNTPEGVNSRQLFAGTDEDARTYIQDNFPRIHVEPGSLHGEDGPPADVALIAPGGSLRDKRGVSFWDGKSWSDDKKDDDKEDDAPATTRRPAAKKVAAKKATR